MTLYIPTSSTSKISSLNVRPDGSGLLSYPEGSTELNAASVGNLLAGADFQLSPLDGCPARVMAQVTGSVGCTYDDSGVVHVFDRASNSCTICSPTPEQEAAAAVELVRGYALALVSAAAELAATPNDIEKVDAALAISKKLCQAVYGS